MIKPLQKHCAHVCQGPFSFVGELLRAYISTKTKNSPQTLNQRSGNLSKGAFLKKSRDFTKL